MIKKKSKINFFCFYFMLLKKIHVNILTIKITNSELFNLNDILD